MKYAKIIQIEFAKNGTMYGLDADGNTWFAYKAETVSTRWHIHISGNEPREV